jgi:hypothetical protein
MKLRLFAALALCAAVPCFAAGDFDWHRDEDQIRLSGAMGNFAGICVDEFGFTRAADLDDEALRSKLIGHLLHAESADAELGQWLGYLAPMEALVDKTMRKEVVDRASDSLLVIDKDPASFTRAQNLYVDTIMAPIRAAFQGCEQAAGNRFLQETLFTGKGSVDKFETMLRADFVEVLKRHSK